jgi:hypothetical protein
MDEERREATAALFCHRPRRLARASWSGHLAWPQAFALPQKHAESAKSILEENQCLNF